MTAPTTDSTPPGASTSGRGGTPRCGTCGRLHLEILPCWSGSYAATRREDVYRAKGRLCWQCRREGRRTEAKTVDHLIARANGGTDDMRNLEPACLTCNSRKGSRTTSPYPDPATSSGNGQPVSGRFR